MCGVDTVVVVVKASIYKMSSLAFFLINDFGPLFYNSFYSHCHFMMLFFFNFSVE